MPIRITIVGFAIVALTAIGASVSHALPDAAVLGIEVEGSDFRGGDRVPMEVQLVNRGDAVLPPVPVALTVNDEPYAEWKLPAPLEPNETATWSLHWAAVRGSHLIVATVDPLNDVREANEGNNSAFINVGAGKEPEPSPFPVILVGLTAFAAGAAAAGLFQRMRRRGAAKKESAEGSGSSQ